MRARLLLSLAPCVLALAACRNDPVPQEIIDGLGDESGQPSAEHRPGQPCLACHTDYQGAAPKLAVGGTIYAIGPGGVAKAAAGVLVSINDSAGDSRSACTNSAGNFFIEQEDWAEVAFPLKVRVGPRAMRSLIGRDGSCASCHKLPSSESLVPGTGAGRDSPGIILVDEAPPDPLCGGGAP
jgi:hypothetical protein